MSPIIDVFTAADTLRAAHLAAENARLRAQLAAARSTLREYDQRLDALTRANARLESPGFKVRTEVTA